MYYTKSLIRFAIVFSVCAVIILGLSPLNSAKCAEYSYDVTPCVSGTFTPLVQSPKLPFLILIIRELCEAMMRAKYLIIAPYMVRGSL